MTGTRVCFSDGPKAKVVAIVSQEKVYQIEGQQVDILDTGVENPILEKVRSGGSGQTFALPTKKKVSEQMEAASALTYASVLKKGLKLAPVAVHSF